MCGDVTTPALSGRSGVTAAESSTGERIIGDLRLVDDRIHHVVVPAIEIVVGDDDGGIFPKRVGLDGVDSVDDERLLVERIRVAGVTIEGRFRFDKAYRRELTCRQRRKEISKIVESVNVRVIPVESRRLASNQFALERRRDKSVPDPRVTITLSGWSGGILKLYSNGSSDGSTSVFSVSS